MDEAPLLRESKKRKHRLKFLTIPDSVIATITVVVKSIIRNHNLYCFNYKYIIRQLMIN